MCVVRAFYPYIPAKTIGKGPYHDINCLLVTQKIFNIRVHIYRWGMSRLTMTRRCAAKSYKNKIIKHNFTYINCSNIYFKRSYWALYLRRLCADNFLWSLFRLRYSKGCWSTLGSFALTPRSTIFLGLLGNSPSFRHCDGVLKLRSK